MSDDTSKKDLRPKSVGLDTPTYLKLRKRAFDTFDDMKELANRYIEEGIARDEAKESEQK